VDGWGPGRAGAPFGFDGDGAGLCRRRLRRRLRLWTSCRQGAQRPPRQHPKAYAYDRGGWSERNVAELKKQGVEEVGLAPREKAEWKVSAATKKRLVSERAQVEGGIRTIKHRRYGFNRPAARSAKMMGFCGQSAVLGFNLNKLTRELAKQEERQLVG